VEDLLDKVMRSYLTNTNLINKRMVGVSIMMESKSAKSEQNRIWNNDACKSYEQNKDKMSPEDNNVSLKIYTKAYLFRQGHFQEEALWPRGVVAAFNMEGYQASTVADITIYIKVEDGRVEREGWPRLCGEPTKRYEYTQIVVERLETYQYLNSVGCGAQPVWWSWCLAGGTTTVVVIPGMVEMVVECLVRMRKWS
jgi:hypothetical protein